MTAPDPLARWDGQWTVAKPADYVPGLYCMHQIEARWILRYARALTEADARLLQTVALQSTPLSRLQKHWLERLERDHMGEPLDLEIDGEA